MVQTTLTHFTDKNRTEALCSFVYIRKITLESVFQLGKIAILKFNLLEVTATVMFNLENRHLQLCLMWAVELVVQL